MIKQILDLVILVLSVLAVPVILVCIYDQLILGPKRPLTDEGVPAPGPRYVRIAYALMPYAIIGAILQIGVKAVFAWFNAVAVVPLSYLAIPVALFCAYDHWVMEPKRPRTAKGLPIRAPLYVRIAYGLLLFVILAVVLRIGPAVLFEWVKAVALPLSWFALPIGLWCLIDSWFLAPRRQIVAGSTDAVDPPLVRAAYTVLPVLVVAVIVRMISAETLDFSLVLLGLSIATGLVWLIDSRFVRSKREASAAAAKPSPVKLNEPGSVDYARSFFPVAFIVLIVRAFIFEPFRIPSDSMMPTLLDGDFIVVNKFAYGLRWPVINEKFLDTDSPQRGDVVVFRFPPNPSINYIKRLVGLPGDRIEVHDDQLVVNGQTIALENNGRYTDGCYFNYNLSTETLGEHTHQVLSCRSAYGNSSPRDLLASGDAKDLPVCDRKKLRESYSGGYLCDESRSAGRPDSSDHVFPGVVPAGHYLMIGDNRDNSEDSRKWGFVPDENLVGKATRIWFNFDLQRDLESSSVVNWSRIGDGIQ